MNSVGIGYLAVNVGLRVRVGQIVRVACSVTVHVVITGYKVSLVLVVVVVVEVCVTGGGIIVVVVVVFCVNGGGIIVEILYTVVVTCDCQCLIRAQHSVLTYHFDYGRRPRLNRDLGRCGWKSLSRIFNESDRDRKVFGQDRGT